VIYDACLRRVESFSRDLNVLFMWTDNDVEMMHILRRFT